MNEEDLLKQLQQYFLQNRQVDRQYDPSQGKVWTDSYSLQDLYQNAMDKGVYSPEKMQTMPNSYQDQTDMTLRRLLEQRNRKTRM